MAAVK
jgi:sperm-associated antigen 1